ncbi:hypothetical protein II582_04090 [bacterium]|nr:hypothetical protein [bacterium]
MKNKKFLLASLIFIAIIIGAVLIVVNDRSSYQTRVEIGAVNPKKVEYYYAKQVFDEQRQIFYISYAGEEYTAKNPLIDHRQIYHYYDGETYYEDTYLQKDENGQLLIKREFYDGDIPNKRKELLQSFFHHIWYEFCCIIVEAILIILFIGVILYKKTDEDCQGSENNEMNKITTG